MLASLYIRDYAIIEELEVDFGSGLNIITGETGAGKSILVGALKMILGERASTDVVRSGARKAIVEGVFTDAESPSLRLILTENQIDVLDRVILRREITASQSRGFINDSPATLAVMREVAAQLIDLHGQHEHQSLLRVETHVEMLDNVGSLGGLLEEYRTSYDGVDELVRERRRLVARERELTQQKELIEFQIQEIDRVGPREGEEEELEAERSVLENAEHLYEATARLYEALYEGEHAVHDQVVLVRNELQDLARIDRSFSETLNEVRSAQIIISEAAKFLQDYNARIEFNPERLEEIRERTGEIERLKRKYGGTLESVLEHRREIGETYDLAADFEGAIQRLDRKLGEAQGALSAAARRLTAKRREVAERVEQAIVAELKKLGMPHARFEARFDHEEDPEGWVMLPSGDGAEMRVAALPNGVDQVEFYITTNVGEELRPLARVASGGEISRIMLALKTILAKSERLPILVFDEIDVGISGSTAQKVGVSMHELAHYHQIIAITHLPQIAARGDVHFLVEKTVDSGRTRTGIRPLEGDARAAHVATLISGTDTSDAAIESARELMAAGRREEH